MIVMFRGISFPFLFFFFFPLTGAGFLLSVFCMAFMSDVFVGMVVVLVDFFVVELEVLVCPKDDLSGVDLMIL